MGCKRKRSRRRKTKTKNSTKVILKENIDCYIYMYMLICKYYIDCDAFITS